MSDNSAEPEPGPEIVSISPAATEDEVAAILAGYEALWPEPTESKPAPPSAWRFSGRWWGSPSRRPFDR